METQQLEASDLFIWFTVQLQQLWWVLCERADQHFCCFLNVNVHVIQIWPRVHTVDFWLHSAGGLFIYDLGQCAVVDKLKQFEQRLQIVISERKTYRLIYVPCGMPQFGLTQSENMSPILLAIHQERVNPGQNRRKSHDSQFLQYGGIVDVIKFFCIVLWKQTRTSCRSTKALCHLCIILTSALAHGTSLDGPELFQLTSSIHLPTRLLIQRPCW